MLGVRPSCEDARRPPTWECVEFANALGTVCPVCGRLRTGRKPRGHVRPVQRNPAKPSGNRLCRRGRRRAYADAVPDNAHWFEIVECPFADWKFRRAAKACSLGGSRLTKVSARMSPEILEGRGMRIRRDDGSSDKVGRMHCDATTGASGGPLHIHPLQEERFIVETGVLLVWRGGKRIRVGPGEDVRIPPRMAHTFTSEAESSFTVEFRPALRTWDFWCDLFGSPSARRGNPRIGALGRLLHAYPDTSAFRFVPAPIQKALAAAFRLGSAGL